MRLYHTTSRRVEDEERLPICESSICKFSGLDYPHICASSRPLSGMGPWVLIIDLPKAKVEGCKYRNLFREEQAEHYALPLESIAASERKWISFEELTGRPWNEWDVVVSDRGHNNGETTNRWGLVWVSQSGVAGAKILKKEDENGREVIKVRITADEYDFNPAQDYIIAEKHWNVKTGRGVKDKWQLTLLAGVMPDWAIFPWAWANWVHDEEVRKDALDHIIRIAPDTEEDIRYALNQTSKANKARAWRNVSEKVGRAIRRDLGPLPGHTWTKVNSMPMRIASRAGGWIPKKDQPQFSHPDESGRVLLASPEGAFPTREYSYEEGTKPKPINNSV